MKQLCLMMVMVWTAFVVSSTMIRHIALRIPFLVQLDSDWTAVGNLNQHHQN